MTLIWYLPFHSATFAPEFKVNGGGWDEHPFQTLLNLMGDPMDKKYVPKRELSYP